MKPIEKDELYEHVSEFLKSRGIELKEGSYQAGIQKSCSILADLVNMSQKGIERAKAEIDKKLEQVRQTIHEKTAPKKPSNGTTRNSKANSRKRSSSPPRRASKAARKAKRR